MTRQLELTEIVEGVPVKYVRGKFKGSWVRVPVRPVRRVCEECGEGFWAWPDSFESVCALCQASGVRGGSHD